MISHSRLLTPDVLLGTIIAAAIPLTGAAAPGVPAITSLSPAEGPVGTTVTIAGRNLSPPPASNIVYFGPVRALVTDATTNSLEAVVPPFAALAPVTVTVAGLTAYSPMMFNPLFHGLQVLNSSSFGPQVPLPSSTDLRGVACGDLDGDGLPDLAVASYAAGTASLYRNLGSSGIITSNSFAPKIDLAAGFSPIALALADLDGDGRLDLVLANHYGPTISICRNTSSPGAISFAPRVGYPALSGPHGLAVQDLNGDGKPEIVVANNGHASGTTVSVFPNNSVPGTIGLGTRFELAAGQQPVFVAITDVDGDGTPDVIAISHLSYEMSVMRNLGTGGVFGPASFAPRVNFTTGTTPHGLVTADLDADGRPDVIVANNGGNSASVFRNTSTPGVINSNSFAPRVDLPSGVGPNSAGVGDINGDGRPDLAISHTTGVTLYLNATTPGSVTSNSFAQTATFLSGAPNAPVLSDLDGDGRPDLVAGGARLRIAQNLIPVAVCTPAPAGLVAWWQAEGNANDTADSNNGQLRGGITFTTGTVGQAFSFNGSDADVRVPSSPSLNVGLAEGFTIEVWINPADVTRWHPVVEWNDGSFGVNFSVADASGAGAGSLWIDVKDTGFNDHFFSTAGGLLVSNAWQHVAVTYLKSTGHTVLYINGVLRAQQTLGSFTPRTIGDLYVGLRPYDGGAGARFAGLMDEVSLYNRALTPAEIQAIYSADGLGKCSLNSTPVAICSNVIVSAGADCQAEASVDGGSFDPDGDPITVSQVPLGPYPLGTNSVTLTVTDNHGASNSCTALVIVLDTTPPLVSCPGDQVLEFQDETGAVATYSITATDLCSAVTLVATPPSGSVFPIGTTSVSVQATDASGNSAQCGFTVTVLGAQGVKSNVLAELVALCARVKPVQPFAQKFDHAIERLACSLNPSYWVDQTHLRSKGGNTAMNEEKLAVNKLREIMDSKKCPVDPAVLQGFIDRIVRCDRLLAVISVQEAARAGLDPRKVAQALEAIAKADCEAAAGRYANAIEHYRNAWRHAAQLRLRASLNPDGSPQVQFVGESGQSYRIEVSTDMVNWEPLGICTADAEGNVQFTDPDAAKRPARFYRVAKQ